VNHKGDCRAPGRLGLRRVVLLDWLEWTP
jgi:hypothetical protein